MPLKNKDGSVYKLSKPNPVGKDQRWWDPDKVVFYNFKWPVITFAETVLPPDPVAPLVEKPAVSRMPLPAPVADSAAENVVFAYCLPAEIQHKVDDLYGDSYATVTYGNKFSVEAIIIEQGDFLMRCWTPVAVGRGSILYPYRRRTGDPMGEHRWWRAKDVVERDGGWVVEAMPSDYQPSFNS